MFEDDWVSCWEGVGAVGEEGRVEERERGGWGLFFINFGAHIFRNYISMVLGDYTLTSPISKTFLILCLLQETCN